MTTHDKTSLFDGRGMTFLQVKDVLSQVSTFHRLLQEHLSELRTYSPRLRLLSEQLARREAALDALLSDAAAQPDPRLEQWMKSAPEIDLRAPLEEAFSSPAQDPDALVSALLEAEAGLIELLDALAEASPTAGVRELFEQLAEREREAERVHQRERLSAQDL